MKLTAQSIANQEDWQAADILLPRFGREKATAAAVKSPTWVHFGAGNIFRAFPALRYQSLLESGDAQAGIIVVEGYDPEIIDAVFTPNDNLSLIVTLRADGSIGKEVLASIVESLKADAALPDWQRLQALFRAPSLQMVSFTITEKGYTLAPGGTLLPDVQRDFAAGPAAPVSYMGKVAALLFERYQAGGAPLALVSMDNCSHNGDKLAAAVRAFAREWADAGHAAAGFVAYVANPGTVSFPWTMIDKITPRPDADVKRMLRECGFTQVDDVVTQKQTFVAPFVNAEETEYLVIEDQFPNGRPPLEKGGIIFTTRETVDKVEKMKVCTCLNPLHTALAIFGCLLGFDKISEEMRDPDLVALITEIGYREALPVVVDPGIIKPEAFLDEVLRLRFPNPFMPDTPQRIAVDTSQKLSIRFGETIKAYAARPDLDPRSLRLIPLVLAGWCRYLLGVDDQGNSFTISPDPRYEEVAAHLRGVALGGTGPFTKALSPIFSDATIFGVDLYEAGVGDLAETYFAELVAGKGAVRSTLRKYRGCQENK